MIKNQNPDLNTKHRSHEGLREAARQKNRDLSQTLCQKKNFVLFFWVLYKT